VILLGAPHHYVFLLVLLLVLLPPLLLYVSGADVVSNDPSEAGFSKSFANKATAYAVTLILIWFAFAATYCMVAMKFKQDTLLYGRAKAD
jgi:hypothetical protein